MAGFFDLMSWAFGKMTPTETEVEISEEAAGRLAENASGETVTRAALTNEDDHTDLPLMTYLEDDEQPEFVFRGMKLLISDENESISRHYPTRESRVLISDRRLLFVVGGRISDDLWEIPLADVVGVEIQPQRHNRYFVIDGEREGNPMTFMADVAIEPNVDDVQAGVEYVGSHAG